MSYKSEHGDIFLLGDNERQQLGYNVSGVNFTVQPNAWYMSSGELAIQRGHILAHTEGASTVGVADAFSINTIIGMALNDCPAFAPVTKTGLSVSSDKNLYEINIANTSGLSVGLLVQGLGIPRNTVVDSIITNSKVIISKPVNRTIFNGSGVATFGKGVEVASEFSVNLNTAIFDSSDVGKVLYMYPDTKNNYQSVGTIGAKPQLTTSRSLAATSGQPLMEIGIVQSPYSLRVGIEGDAKGATGLTQITADAGEPIFNTGTPLAVSMGNDGRIYIADKRKAFNDYLSTISILSNNTGASFSDFSFIESTVVNFVVTSGSTEATTLTWGGSASGNVTIPSILTTQEVATAIVNAPPSGWTVKSEGSAVTMVYPGVTTTPTLTVNGGVLTTVLNSTSDYSKQGTLVVRSNATTTGSIVLSTGTTISITSGDTANTVASKIANAFSSNPYLTVTANTNTLTFTSKVNANRNTPIGFIVSANAGFGDTGSLNKGTDISGPTSLTKVAYSPSLGRYVMVGSFSGSSKAWYSPDGLSWTETPLSTTEKTWNSVVWVGGTINKFFAVAQSYNYIASSSDGITWSETLLEATTRNWTNIEYSPTLNQVVAISSQGYTAVTANGTLWTVSVSAVIPQVTWRDFKWVPSISKFVAVASSINNNVATFDGTLWVTSGASGVPANGFINMAFSSKTGRIYALPNGNGSATNKIFYSTNGLAWIDSDLPVSAFWSLVTYSEERNELIAIANTTNGLPVFAKSVNGGGSAWTTLNVTSTLTTATYNFTDLIWNARNNNYILTVNQDASSVLSYYTSSIAPQGLVTVNTPCIIQKVGSINNNNWVGLNKGQQMFLSTFGTFTTDPANINYYSDVLAPLGYVNDTKTIYINISFNEVKGSDVPIGYIKALPPNNVADYGYVTCDGSAVNRVGDYAELFATIGTTYGSGNGTTTFNLPPDTTPKLQIKYKNWYSYDPKICPTFRYDTGYTLWNSVPSGCLGIAKQYIQVPTTAFGINPQISDLFAEVYIKSPDGLQEYKIDPNPIVYTYTSGTVQYKRYGYQLQQDPSPGYVRLNFGTDGLAYYVRGASVGSDFVAVTDTWSYRIIVYQTNRYNSFLDVYADTKLRQLWDLGLKDLTTPFNTSSAGFLDRSNTNPSATTRLNYNGNLHTTNLTTTNGINSGTTIASGTNITATTSISAGTSITGQTLVSTIATGTPPLTVTSTTLVSNLNSDMVDGKNVGTSGNTIPLLDGANTWSGVQTFGVNVNLSNLTASTALALDGSKNIISVTNTGTGNNVLATSPVLVTPNIGVATATTINKVTITAPTTSSTLTIADGKSAVFTNSLTVSGADKTFGGTGTAFNLNGAFSLGFNITGNTVLSLPTSGTVVTKDSTDTFTNKTLDTADTGNVLKINTNTVNAITGTGNTVVLSNSPTITTPTIQTIYSQAASGGSLVLRSNSTNTTTGNVSIPMTTASTSYTTGSFIVSGGVGIAGDVYTNGIISCGGNLTVGGSLTVNGTISQSGSVAAKTFFAGPNASSGVPSFRLIVPSDIPTLNQDTTGTASFVAANGVNPTQSTVTVTFSTVNATTVTANTFSATSKRSEKENISKFEDSGLDLIKNVEVVNFTFKKDEDKNRHIGFIADDTSELLSSKDHDKMDLINCIGVLMKSVQELSEKVEYLEAKINKKNIFVKFYQYILTLIRR